MEPTIAPYAEARETLISDHDDIDVVLKRLLVRAAGGDAADVVGPWRAMESALLRHLEAEERYLLPLFEKEDAAEAAWLRGEHAKIRSILDDFGLGIELHTVRLDALHGLEALLRAHAAREEATLYRWIARGVPEAQLARMREHLRP